MDLRKIGIGIALLAIAGVVVWAAVTRLGGDDGAEGTGDGGGDVSATAAPQDARIFTGTTLDGQPFDLADYEGAPVVVNFWASWCGFCGAEMPELIEFAARHPEVKVVGVAVNDEEEAARAAADQWGLTFPSVLDPEGTIFAGFDGQGLPTTVFFDAELQVKDTIIGQTDLAGFEAGLENAE